MKKIIRKILREDVDIILYDKVIRLMRRPYINFLREIVGLKDEKSVTEIMKRKLGDGKFVYREGGGGGKLTDDIVYEFTWFNINKGFYEERKYGSGRVDWAHSEKTINDSITNHKKINSYGEKSYSEYDTKTKGNWVYIDSKRYPNLNGMGDDKFFSNVY